MPETFTEEDFTGTTTAPVRFNENDFAEPAKFSESDFSNTPSLQPVFGVTPGELPPEPAPNRVPLAPVIPEAVASDPNREAHIAATEGIHSLIQIPRATENTGFGPWRTMGPVGNAALNLGGGVVEGVTDPRYWLLGLLKPAAAIPAVAGLFAPPAVESLGQGIEATRSGDVQGAIEGYGNAALGLALTGHMASRPAFGDSPMDRIANEIESSSTPITAGTVAAMREAAVAPARNRIFEADFRPKPIEATAATVPVSEIPQAAQEVAATTTPNADTIQSPVEGVRGEPPGPAAQVAEGITGEVQQPPGARPAEIKATTETGQAAATVAPKFDWDLYYENLAGDLESFSPARNTGKTDYDLQDVASRFVEFAKTKDTGDVIELLNEFRKTDEATSTQLKKLRASLTNLGDPKSTISETPQATAGETAAEVATPTETPPQIGIRNAVTDQVREAMGLNERTKPDRIGGEQQLQEASNLIAQDPQLGSRLVDELGQKPRPLTYQEDGILTYELAARVTEHRAAMKAVEEATTPEAKAEAETRLANARDRVAAAVEADANAGTENARGLEARKRLIDEQYSLPVMEANRRIAKQEPLTRPELDRLKAHADELDALEKKIQERAQANAVQTARQAFTQLLSEHANTVREAKASGGTIVQFLDKQAEAARQRIKERLTGAKSTATDPVTAALAHLADEAIIGASHIAHGLKDIGEWSKKMIAEFGEVIRPHLDKIYGMAQDYHDSSEPLFKPQRKGKTPEIRDAAAEAKAAADAGDGLTRKTVYDLARAHVKDGMTNLDEVMEAVRKDLEPSFPGVTVRDIRDTFSDYGKTKLPNPAADLKTLRDLRAQSQKISALEDVARKQAPKRSGMQRDKPSDVVRELTRKLNEAMREAGIEVTSPEQQLKTSLDAVKTRLKNQLSDLDREISQLEKGIVERKEKTGIKYDEEANRLKAQRDAKATVRDSLREALVGVEPRKGLTPEQAERNALAAAKRSLEEYQRRVREKDFVARRKPAKEASDVVKAARAERDAAKTEFEQLRDALKPKLSPEQAAIKRAKQANERSIKELERKLATKDFAAKVRGAQPIDSELESLQARKQRLRDQVDRETEAIRLSKRGIRERIGDNFVRIERAMKLSGPAVLGKLTMAAATRLGTTRAEAVLSRGLSKLPVINRIAAKAPSMAGRRVSSAASATAKAVTDGLMDGLRQMKNVLKTGQSDLDVRLGKRRIAPENPWVEAFGRMHAALKNPVKYDAFRLSLEQRVEHGIRNGVDVTNPAVHLQMMKDAYIDANRAIFMQDNFLSNAYQMGVGYLRRGASFKEGQPGFAAAQSLGHLAQFLLPIVKVPTNIAFETGSYAGGLAKASVGVAKALKNGMDTVSPEQADDIMRHLTKGSIGAGLLLLGFYNPENIGGYYQPGEKRKLNEPKASGFRLFGENLPRWVAHAPVFEVLQMGATIRRVSDQIVKATGQKKGLEAGGEAAAMGLLKEVPFMDEMHRLNSLMGTDSEKSQYLGELAKGTLVPAVSQQAASFFDTHDSEGNPVARKPTSIWQHVKMGIPGLRETVPLKPQPKTTR